MIATVGLRAQRQVTFFASFVNTSSDQPIDTVSQDQVEVREDDVAGRVLRMEPMNWPVRVELLLDNGIGIGSDNLSHLREGVRLHRSAASAWNHFITTAPQPRTVVGRPPIARALSGAGLLAPERSAPRFIDALSETAARLDKTRVDKERGNFFPVVVAGFPGSRSIFTDRDVSGFDAFSTARRHVHVVMLSSGGITADGGATQVQIGMAIAKMTGGRYDNISAPSRIRTLLPEIARQIARSHARQSKQFRITFERPDGKAGQVGHVTLAGPASLTIQLSTDGRIP
jgi:hypothetical protein